MRKVEKHSRVSTIYVQVPIDEKAVDKALKKYAARTKARFLHEGKIPGLSLAYDDYVADFNADKSEVAIKRK